MKMIMMNRKCIIEYFEKGYTMRQIGEKCECSHSTVIRFLKRNYPKDKYTEINSKKIKKYQTRKYKLWNAKNCRYFKQRYDKKPFGYFYNNRYVPIGLFDDFVSIETINKFVE